MTTLNNKNFEFMATISGILKYFNNNANVVIENLKLNDYCDSITLDVYFANSETARKDFFGFFESIGYETNEINGCVDEDYYDIEDYPDGAIVIPEFVTLEFNSEVEEVIYRMKSWDIKAK